MCENKTNKKDIYSSFRTSLISVLILTSFFSSIVIFGQAADPNLVMYLPLDEGTGSVANDASGNGNVGVINGAASFITGVSGTAIQFDGIDDTIIVNTSDILESVNELTVACWVKINHSIALRYFIVTSQFSLFQSGNETGLAIILPDTNSARGLTLVDEWKQITGTYDGTDINYYVDGVHVGTKNWPGTMDIGSRTFIIGFFNAVYWDGAIDEICVWNKAFTAEEVENHFNNTNCAPVPLSPIFLPLLTVIGILIVFRKRK